MGDLPQVPLPYRHAQVSYPILAGLALGTAMQVRKLLHHARANKPGTWRYVSRLFLLLALMLAFSRLTVEVDRRQIAVGFAGGFARRRIDLRTVEAATSTKVPWLSGWGIRLTPRGWLYNASGRRAVQIRRVSGRRFIIGSDEPATLLAAIEHARAQLADA
jgi:hypothetical protein